MSNDDLVAALVAFSAADTSDSRRRVLEELGQSELIFPMAERAPDDPGVRLAFTEDAHGRPVLPAFTDEAQLSIWLVSGGPYAKAPASGFLPSVLAGPFVGLALNPGSDASAFVDRRALELLASGNLSAGDDGVQAALVARWPTG
jgi:hypothetical protein